MTTGVLEMTQPHRYEQRTDGMYKVGERVVWKALHRNSHNYLPNEMIEGVVIAAFENGLGHTYQIELDRVWVEYAGEILGKKIVVGNVFAGRIFLLTKS